METIKFLLLPEFGTLFAEDEGESVEPEAKERQVTKIPYLDFAAREAKGEVVDRSVLVDAKYAEDGSGDLISGKLMSIPPDLDPKKYRLPGRKFWNDETMLLTLKKQAVEADIAELQSYVNELNDTITELSSIGDPAQRAQFAAARRALSTSMKILKEGGFDVTIEDLLARLSKAKS